MIPDVHRINISFAYRCYKVNSVKAVMYHFRAVVTPKSGGPYLAHGRCQTLKIHHLYTNDSKLLFLKG